MATVTKSESNFASKADKPKRVLAPLTARIMDQLSKAVLGKKISKDELIRLSAHITKLEAFVET